VLLVSIGLVVAGCISARSRADAAFDRGDYVTAADGYAALAEQAPGDVALRNRRDDARRRALVMLATRVRRIQAANQPEDALPVLADLLSQRRRWPALDDAAVAHAVEAEVASAGSYMQNEIERLVIVRQPLAAEHAIAVWREQLVVSEFDPVWPALEQVARAGGDAICRAALPAEVDLSPYLSGLAAAYCAHFDVEARVPERLPHGVAGVAIAGAISGMTEEQRERLEAALARLVRATAWFDAAADDTRARVALAGEQAVAFGANQVELTAQWWESVSHMEQETYQEPYQESYQESYTVQVPYTEYHTESYSCGFGTSTTTCTRSVSSTSYRSETQYRTAFRTAYRTAWRTVTKWTQEPRYYKFHAVERVGNYSGAWNLAIDLGGDVPPLKLRVADHDRRVGYDQDAEFAAAHVAPSRAHLPSFDDWFGRLLERLERTLPNQLARHWSTAFCQIPSFTAETAARCAYGGTPPPAARAELARLYGPEVDLVMAQFARATSH
jgi:hypothetical protein